MEEIIIPTELQQKITSEQAWHYKIIPMTITESEVAFYIDEENHARESKEELEMLFNKRIELVSTSSNIINKALGKYYRKSQKKKQANDVNFLSDDFVENIIAEANDVGSSDIHFEVFEEVCRLRIRIDGKLVERYVIDKYEYPAIINKIKIKANMDIAEKRLPQDGRIFYHTPRGKFDIRVSVLPTLHGEKVVMRLLSKDATSIDINLLGFSDAQLKLYLEGIKKPHGIVLISGPTGSGKTTTLYATLKILNKEETNILTIEDPIEYTLDGINQVQLKEDIGLNFSRALRTFLRQDPDIIMLGEIRDNETAQMAIRAALTGHMVLSTIHTNSAWGTISRLIDMGIPEYLLANTINLSIAQRLIRLLCPSCKKQMSKSNESFPKGIDESSIPDYYYEAVGCDDCYYTGFKGRKAIYEIIPVNRKVADFIKQKSNDVQQLLNENDIKTLSDSALNLFSSGLTSIEEIYPILLADESI